MDENDAEWADRWACPVCGRRSDDDDRRAVSIPGDEPDSELRFCSATCAEQYRNAADDILAEIGYADRLLDGFALMHMSENLNW